MFNDTDSLIKEVNPKYGDKIDQNLDDCNYRAHLKGSREDRFIVKLVSATKSSAMKRYFESIFIYPQCGNIKSS